MNVREKGIKYYNILLIFYAKFFNNNYFMINLGQNFSIGDVCCIFLPDFGS